MSGLSPKARETNGLTLCSIGHAQGAGELAPHWEGLLTTILALLSLKLALGSNFWKLPLVLLGRGCLLTVLSPSLVCSEDLEPLMLCPP